MSAVLETGTSKERGVSKRPLNPWKPAKQAKAPKPVTRGIGSLNGKWGYLFIAPFFVMFLIFGLAPIVYSTYIAF